MARPRTDMNGRNLLVLMLHVALRAWGGWGHGLRVLMVQADPLCLKKLMMMMMNLLRACGNQVEATTSIFHKYVYRNYKVDLL